MQTTYDMYIYNYYIHVMYTYIYIYFISNNKKKTYGPTKNFPTTSENWRCPTSW